MRILFAFLINLLVNFAVGLMAAAFLGPDQFGRFAVAMGLGAAIQVLAFDWIRLAAARSYSEHHRWLRPEIRSTLDLSFLTLAFGLALAAGCVLVIAPSSIVSAELLAGALIFAIANGHFDYQAALLRARFADRAYGRLVLTKNVLALLLTAGVAWATGSALATLAGACLGLAVTTLTMRFVTRDEAAGPRAARGETLRTSLAYGMPLSASSLLYLVIPLADRWLASRWFGFAESGQLALAQDVGLRLVMAIGTALDVLLFQFAVRAEHVEGAEGARAKIASNMGVIFAITLPATAGVWLVLPSFEALIVPAEFRGPFAHYLTLLLPGLFLFGLMSFALAPAFQMERRTWPVTCAAAIAVTVNAGLAFALSRGVDARVLALAQTTALCAGFVALACFAGAARLSGPRLVDLAGASLATAAMCGLTYPLRGLEPGVATLLLQAGAGGILYGLLALAFDLAGLRSALRAWLERRRQSRLQRANET